MLFSISVVIGDSMASQLTQFLCYNLNLNRLKEKVKIPSHCWHILQWDVLFLLIDLLWKLYFTLFCLTISPVLGSYFSDLWHWILLIYGLFYLLTIIPLLNELSGVYLDFLPIYGAIGDDTILYPLILSIRNYTSRFISFDTLHLVKSVLSAKMRPYWFGPLAMLRMELETYQTF